LNFRDRSYQKEMLDSDNIPFKKIERNMKELEFINKNLGGHSITLEGFKKVLSFLPTDRKEITICEIGCGGGDNLRVIYDWCKMNAMNCRLIGIDINPDCIEFAKKNSASLPAEWIAADYKKVMFDEEPDIVFNSLFCHHFNETELGEVFRWMKENSSAGFFINDLQRNPLAYYSIKILTALFSKSDLVKNDAPLSVLRGFKKSELEKRLRESGIHNFTIEWKWAFRWLVISRTHE
jgi:2-polyprenyl-3-methyl-5-hydroxy-6-metoxy-1,4-benzoquinol methylase